ncbi:MAG: hypothetical protein FRX48_00673 [Lasallia pustulata]|uniref:Uncharacterized protein n=1 Tax=Lasallia pustulata TaxID=136370 RepID=A0A5M8Q196_9LECA|nr:MAG: hypothetical protein FRX48_00673 [Lasallia pustulata]
MERKDACTALAEITDTYTSAASSAYLDMPEDISLMILTSMDLWVALDKCAMQHYPLLRDYDPDFPPSLFKPLLLPRKAQMERLFRVEQYLATRRKASIPGLPSIFQSVNTEKNFAVMYFQQSPHHQKLRRDIEAEATNERSQKVSELAEKRQRYAGTRNYFKSQAGRIQLTSTTKPFVVSHYRYKEVSQANKTNTCVNNGLTYSLYDSKRMRWTKELLNCCDVREKCPPKLPAGPYGRLQYAVNNTIHTSNEVIASQAEGSEALTLHEFYAFGTLRTGHRLQWRNIARELTARVLDFNCHETHALLTQAAWQVGPFGKERARAISLRWTRKLGQKLQEGQEEELKTLNARTLEMALTCHGTFNVDPHHLPYLLESDEDIAVVAECSIIVHDRCPAATDNLPASIKTLLRRYWRLLHTLEPLLHERILEVRNGLDSTVSQLWAGYAPGCPWTALETPSERWLVTETSSEGGLSSMLVHYNLLDGSLLVNGSPLTRLPRSYESHPTFRRLFGEKVLNVVPSTMNGMVFEARNELFDHQLYFGMYGTELIIQARKQGQAYELLPVQTLDGFVEWRPLHNAWMATSQNWQMQSDLHTPTAKAVSAILNPLEHGTHLHITFDFETEVSDVHLLRLKLDFFLSNGATQLESKQFRGMTVDTNQSFGTLTGLVNRLVLRGKDNFLRSIIIPQGDILFKPEGHHIHVHINTSSQNISYHLYHIDSQIGRLVDNGSLKSKLFKCYLHAVTAHCLTDELTGRTGTEEALSILASASVRSFLSLGQMEIDLLVLLAQITPRRQFYPRHL